MKIRIPATSANLGIGFDSLGLSLSLYNTYEIKKAQTSEILNYNGLIDQHLVFKSYKAFYEFNQKPIINVTIEELQQEIPISNGLGSSAACILAGVLAANEIGGLGATFDQCVKFCADYEGHPDNIFAAAYGGLIAVYKEEDTYYHQKFPIHESFKFSLLVPEAKGKTSDLRKAIPSQIDHKDAIHNLSRIIHLPKAFDRGDLNELKRLIKDKLHEPYRYPFIPHHEAILELKKMRDMLVTISGSGLSLLVISSKNIDNYLTETIKDTYQVINVQISEGIKIEK